MDNQTYRSVRIYNPTPLETSDGHILSFLKQLNKDMSKSKDKAVEEIEESNKLENLDNSCAMYIIVNSDLKMGKGKIASQCCHSACRVTRIAEGMYKKPIIYRHWVSSGEAKIVLKASHEQLLELIKMYDVRKGDHLWCTNTIDAGCTQILPGSLTTVAFCPMMKKDVPELIKNLKLL